MSLAKFLINILCWFQIWTLTRPKHEPCLADFLFNILCWFQIWIDLFWNPVLVAIAMWAETLSSVKNTFWLFPWRKQLSVRNKNQCYFHLNVVWTWFPWWVFVSTKRQKYCFHDMDKVMLLYSCSGPHNVSKN